MKVAGGFLFLSSLALANPLANLLKRGGSSSDCQTTGCGALEGLGQISDGQVRAQGTNLPVPTMTLTIENGFASDEQQRICYISDAGQFQCNGGTITNGDFVEFSICGGMLAYNGSTEFWSCSTGDNGDNVYVKSIDKVCTPLTIKVTSSSSCPTSTSPPPPPTISSTCIPLTVTESCPAPVTKTEQVTCTVTASCSPVVKTEQIVSTVTAQAPPAVTKTEQVTCTVTASCPAPVTVTVTKSAPPAPPATSSSICTASTNYPHLLVPVNSAQPSKSYGTGYNVTCEGTISTCVLFDVTTSGQCQLNFYLPLHPGSETSSPFTYSVSENAQIDCYELTSTLEEDCTYANKPARGNKVTTFTMTRGQNIYGYSFECTPGTMSYELVAQSGSSLNLMEDYNPPASGLVINSC